MSFAGHVLDMIKRSENNRAMLRNLHEQAAGQRRRNTGSRDARPTEAERIAPEHLEKVLGQIRAETRTKKRKEDIALLLIGIAVCALLLAAWQYWIAS